MTAPLPDVSMQLRGAAELDRILGGLEPKLQKTVLRAALRKAGNVIRDEARARAPVGEVRRLGAGRPLRQSIRTSVVSRRGRLAALVGVMRPRGAAIVQSQGAWAYYATWVELGHRIVPRGRSRRWRTGALTRLGALMERGPRLRPTSLTERRRTAGGRVRARPFLLPALQAKQQAAEAALMQEIARRLAELVAP